MKLRRKNTYLNSIPEGTPRRRLMAILAKFLYFFVIGGVVVYVAAYFLIHYYLYIFTNGQVDVEKYYVQANRDCEIIRFFVKKGDQVKVGDKLIKISTQQSNDAKKRFLYTEKLDTQLKTDHLKSKLAVLRKDLRKREREREKYHLLHNTDKLNSNDYSGLSSGTRTYSDITKDINDLTQRIELLEAELANYTLYKKKLEQEDSIASSFKFDEVLTSRFDGVVNKLNKQVYEFAYKGENLITIEDPEKIIIKAYFEPEFLNYLYEGKKVRITFSDGETSEGIIKKVYSSALQYNTNIINVARGSIKVMTDIEPVDEQETKRWKRYIGMELQIRTARSRK